MDNQNSRIEWLLESLIHVIGRIGKNNEDILSIVGNNPKQFNAYNLCDGRLTFSEISKKSKISKGNLSHTIDRWVNNGIMFRFKEGNELRLLHVFPISNTNLKKQNNRK